MRKHIISFALCSCLASVIIFAMSSSAMADAATSGKCGENLTWSLASGILTISGTGEMNNYANNQPWDCNEIKAVSIESGVTSIGDFAFTGCINMTSASIPNSVTNIGICAFANCANLDNVSIPAGVVSIESEAFKACSSLTSLTIPDDVTNIGQNAFAYCTGLTSVQIFASATNFKWYGAFEGCTGLTSAGPIGGGYSIEFGWTDIIPKYAFSGCHSLTSVTIPFGITSIGDYAFYECSSLTSVTIPDGVTSIGMQIFYNCTSLIKVRLPASLDRIRGAFDNCTGLSSAGPIGGGYDVEFSWSDSIPNNAFSDWKGLTNVTIPNGVTSINGNAFSGCSNLASIQLPTSLTRIEGHAFAGCSGLVTVDIPDEVDYIGHYAFSGCDNLISVVIPAGLTGAGTGVFFDCANLAYVTIPESATGYRGDMLYGCAGLTSAGPIGGGYNIEFGWTREVPDNAFKYCNYLNSVTIPYGIASIGYQVFSECSDLASVIIPSSVTSIKPDAFSRCNNLKDIYYGGSESDWKATDAGLYGINATVHYNVESAESSKIWVNVDSGTLQSGTGWALKWQYSAFKDKQGQLSQGTLSISMDGFNLDEELIDLFYEGTTNYPWLSHPEIRIENTTTLRIAGNSRNYIVIPDRAFQGFTNLKKLEMESVSFIGESAFDGDEKLSDVKLYGVKDLGPRCFAKTGISDITLNQTVERIYSTAFDDCNNLLIRCYPDTAAHQFAERYGYQFILLQENAKPNTVYYGDGQHITFSKSIEELASQVLSTQYSPELSYQLMALSFAAYDESSVKKSYESLGFATSEYDTFNYYEPFDSRYGLHNVAFTLGKKTLDSGETFVLITIRGSQGDFIQSVDWTSNFSTRVDQIGWHTGFELATNKLYDQLSTYLGGIPTSNVQYVITGHSRGAAVGNLLSVKLFDAGVPKRNVYDYNFACPDVAVGLPTGWNWINEHDNIFNICRREDPVALVPGNFVSEFTPPGTQWGKFGRTLWFSDNEYDTLSFEAHNPQGYLNFMGNCFSSDQFPPTDSSVLQDILREFHGFVSTVRCPVDVEITDLDGNMVATVIDGQLMFYGNPDGTVFVLTDGEQKYIYLQGSRNYRLHLAATDTGTMSFAVTEVNLYNGESGDSKGFEAVALEKDKEMISNIGVNTQTRNVALYVIDGKNGDPVKEVLPDSKGTEVPVHIITIDPNGGILTGASSMVTNADQKLATMPTPPIRDGYKLNGWFTKASGGDPVTTDTVFTANTTIYAQWSTTSSPMKYIVTVQNDGHGTGSANPSSAETGTEIELTASPSAGYKFKEWEVISGDVMINNGKFAMPDSNVTVKAIFESSSPSEPNDKQFTITFIPNGGYLVGASTMITTLDGKLMLYPTVYREGYSFSGWYTTDGILTTVGTIFSGDTTLHARWILISEYTPIPPSITDNPSGSQEVAHSIAVPNSSDGKVTVNPSSAKSGTIVTISVSPNQGYEVQDIQVVNADKQDVSLSPKGNGKYTFVMPDSNITINVSFRKIEQTSEPTDDTQQPKPMVTFEDITTNDYFYDAVLWAVDRKITNGYGDTKKYAPNVAVDRGQMATYLYRYSGEPSIGTLNPFTDLLESAYYYNPVLWLADSKISSGTTATTYSPEMPVDRKQMAMFLWRLAGCPEPTITINPFTDVDESSIYYTAILWVAEMGITNGYNTPDIYAPDVVVDRGQMAVYLYRFDLAYG